jgi:4-hydroxythreonine-4-phosphate dehydrogenase
MMSRPLLAWTLGDPTGVGPEVVVGAWLRPEVHEFCRPVAVGNAEMLRRAAKLLKADVEVREVSDPAEADSSPQVICCLRAGSDEVLDAPPAMIDARGGQAAYDALLVAAQLAIDRRIDGLVTAPLHKAALWLAGHRYPGHTELLAELCGIRDVAMMLYLAPDATIRGPAGLGVVHVTLHMALSEVWTHLTPDAIITKVRLAHDVMRAFDLPRPRIGVCALNPHAGESGLFGDEETRIIAPAIERARGEGFDAQGPFSTDTLMVRARDGEFDAVVAMYHDQGHIALKLLGMHRAVNVTLGLPIVRTSVAHGTALDLAWQGRAEVGSMIEAAKVAAALARNKATSG